MRKWKGEVAKRRVGVELDIDAGELGRVIDPRRFVESHGVIGGPSPEGVREAIERRRMGLEKISDFLERKMEALRRSKELLESGIRSIIGL